MMITRIRPKKIAAGLVLASLAALCAGAPIAAAQSAAQPASAPAKTLDYEVFKNSVEPIFLKRRSPNHARCYACHEKTKHFSGLMLESLPPGSSFWTEEQSRRNFETVSKLVVPGNLNASMFPMHPLAPEAGGDTHVHNGGRQFESQDDPDFKTIAEWIRGRKAGGPSNR
jgi:hypothetical protein